MASESGDRSRILKDIALDEGFELAGIASPSTSPHVGFLERWIAEGRHGDMGYLARPDSLRRRADLRLTLPEVRAILCVAEPYHRSDPLGIPDDRSRGVIARYARGRDYHRVVDRRLRRVHRRFQERIGEPVPARAYVDTGPILERELARRAGVGWFGRNTMLIHPRKGSYFFLGILLVGMDLEPDEPFEKDHCGSCRACLDACPTGALLGRDCDGAPVMDATRCISYVTIETRGPVARELRPLIGNRIFGCDICQEVCPFNDRFEEGAADPAYAARGPGEAPAGVEPARMGEESPGHPGTDGPPLVELIAMDRATWDSFSRGSAIRRAGYAGFLRNVAVALGNWGVAEAVPALAGALDHPEALVRGHAAWALGQIGSGKSRVALGAALKREADTAVLAEIEDALV